MCFHQFLGYLDKNKQLPKRTVFALAAYIVFYRGTFNGETIDTNDNQDILDLYAELWKDFDGSKEAITRIVQGVLGYESNWDGDLNTIANMTNQVADYVEMILNEGMEAVIKAINEVK